MIKMTRITAPDCPHCEAGTVHVDKPWLGGVCVDCGHVVNATTITELN